MSKWTTPWFIIFVLPSLRLPEHYPAPASAARRGWHLRLRKQCLSALHRIRSTPMLQSYRAAFSSTEARTVASGLAGEALMPGEDALAHLRDGAIPREWEDAAEAWLFYLQSARKAKNTITLYQMVVLNHYFPWLAAMGIEGLGSVRSGQLRQWVISLERQGLAASSVG